MENTSLSRKIVKLVFFLNKGHTKCNRSRKAGSQYQSAELVKMVTARFPFMFSGVLQACHQKIIARIIGPIIHQIIPSQLRRMTADFILPSFIMASKVLLTALFPREDVIVKFRHLFLCSEIVTVRIF